MVAGDEDIALVIRMVNYPLNSLPYLQPIIISSISLLTAPTNAPPPKHCPNWGPNADHNGAVCQFYHYMVLTK